MDRHAEDRATDWDAVRIAAGDNIAVALRSLQSEARVLADGDIRRVMLTGDIPMGHKFALADLPAGAEIRKYGCVIGILTREVSAGEHVHVHNLLSARAQRTRPSGSR